ncbi:hypothetical protein [Natrarchaeobaculum sulfurireducens]|uniref:Uncharacterized protein n=1 Tax=Natrarchaeobaculum sulfurireducens TaxID=2044521 RepID=A0A346PPN8_9EURY|nr:hypothetical protein [Natrarchaeobaculum sulfurireducens]AXR81483.1 hypothetical protein AArcMg_1470 [Natrarchaeobaculum sulfurireducens]
MTFVTVDDFGEYDEAQTIEDTPYSATTDDSDWEIVSGGYEGGNVLTNTDLDGFSVQSLAEIDDEDALDTLPQPGGETRLLMRTDGDLNGFYFAGENTVNAYEVEIDTRTGDEQIAIVIWDGGDNEYVEEASVSGLSGNTWYWLRVKWDDPDESDLLVYSVHEYSGGSVGDQVGPTLSWSPADDDPVYEDGFLAFFGRGDGVEYDLVETEEQFEVYDRQAISYTEQIDKAGDRLLNRGRERSATSYADEMATTAEDAALVEDFESYETGDVDDVTDGVWEADRGEIRSSGSTYGGDQGLYAESDVISSEGLDRYPDRGTEVELYMDEPGLAVQLAATSTIPIEIWSETGSNIRFEAALTDEVVAPIEHNDWESNSQRMEIRIRWEPDDWIEVNIREAGSGNKYDTLRAKIEGSYSDPEGIGFDYKNGAATVDLIKIHDAPGYKRVPSSYSNQVDTEATSEIDVTRGVSTVTDPMATKASRRETRHPSTFSEENANSSVRTVTFPRTASTYTDQFADIAEQRLHLRRLSEGVAGTSVTDTTRTFDLTKSATSYAAPIYGNGYTQYQMFATARSYSEPMATDGSSQGLFGDDIYRYYLGTQHLGTATHGAGDIQYNRGPETYSEPAQTETWIFAGLLRRGTSFAQSIETSGDRQRFFNRFGIGFADEAETDTERRLSLSRLGETAAVGMQAMSRRTLASVRGVTSYGDNAYTDALRKRLYDRFVTTEAGHSSTDGSRFLSLRRVVGTAGQASESVGCRVFSVTRPVTSYVAAAGTDSRWVERLIRRARTYTDEAQTSIDRRFAVERFGASFGQESETETRTIFDLTKSATSYVGESVTRTIPDMERPVQMPTTATIKERAVSVLARDTSSSAQVEDTSKDVEIKNQGDNQ